MRLTNNTGTAIGAIAVSFVGEQWRAAEAATQALEFQYQVGSVSDANSPSGGWTTYAPLSFESPIDTTAGQLDGNDPANRTAQGATLTFPIPVTNGQQILITGNFADADFATEP